MVNQATVLSLLFALTNCRAGDMNHFQLYMCASEIHKLIQSANYQRHRLYRATVVWSVHSFVGQWPLFTGPMSRLIKIESRQIGPLLFPLFPSPCPLRSWSGPRAVCRFSMCAFATLEYYHSSSLE